MRRVQDRRDREKGHIKIRRLVKIEDTMVVILQVDRVLERAGSGLTEVVVGEAIHVTPELNAEEVINAAILVLSVLPGLLIPCIDRGCSMRKA